MKRFLCIVFAMSALLVLLISCRDTSSGVTSSIPDDEQRTNESESTQMNAEDEEDKTFEVTVNGIGLSEYQIVYPVDDSAARLAAMELALDFSENFGVSILLKADNETPRPHEILVGDVARDTSAFEVSSLKDGQFVIAPVEKDIWLYGADAYLLNCSVEAFARGVRKTAEEAALGDFLIAEALVFSGEREGLRIMSFNVRFGEYTQERVDLVIHMVELYAPDVIGFQEADARWRTILGERLFGRYTAAIPTKGNTANGANCQIFYKKDSFEVLECQTRWLSETPDVAGTKVEESADARYYTFARFREVASGREFYHVNTHLYPYSAVAKEKQTAYLIEFLQTLPADVPCFVSGDFNCHPTTKPFEMMREAGFYSSSVLAEKSEGWITYTGFGLKKEILDYIYVKGDVHVLFYRACDQTYPAKEAGEVLYPSDHSPIFMDFLWS